MAGSVSTTFLAVSVYVDVYLPTAGVVFDFFVLINPAIVCTVSMPSKMTVKYAICPAVVKDVYLGGFHRYLTISKPESTAFLKEHKPRKNQS